MKKQYRQSMLQSSQWKIATKSYMCLNKVLLAREEDNNKEMEPFWFFYLFIAHASNLYSIYCTWCKERRNQHTTGGKNTV